jgi:hypothetical protein
VDGYDLHDLNMAILDQLKQITQGAGAFVAGVLSNDISRDDQIVFALRLVRLAEQIKERADNTVGMVIEGTEQCLKPVDVDDREGRTFPVIE